MICDNFSDHQKFVLFHTHVYWLFWWRDIWRKEEHPDSIPLNAVEWPGAIQGSIENLMPCAFPHMSLKYLIEPFVECWYSIQAFFYWKYKIGQEFPQVNAGSFAFLNYHCNRQSFRPSSIVANNQGHPIFCPNSWNIFNWQENCITRKKPKELTSFIHVVNTRRIVLIDSRT